MALTTTFNRRILLNLVVSVLLSMVAQHYAYCTQPITRSLTKREYNAASQNWRVVQDEQGIIYVANHNGLLEYNNNRWQLHRVKGFDKSIRAIYIDQSSGRIYVGLFEEFGYFKRDDYGSLCYHSLSDQLDYAEIENSQIWSIVREGEDIHFQYFNRLYTFDGEVVVCRKQQAPLYTLHRVVDKIYTSSNDSLYLFEGGRKRALAAGVNAMVSSCIALPDSSLLVISNQDMPRRYCDGVLTEWRNNISEELRNAMPNVGLLTKDHNVVVGTVMNGVYGFDLEGQLLWHIDANRGLSNNTVLGLLCDAENNIWVATDNGISFIHTSTPITISENREQNFGFIYDIFATEGENLLVATNQGLYRVDDIDISHASLIPRTKGYVQTIHEARDGSLFVGHSRNTYILDSRGSQISQSFKEGGSMCFRNIELEGSGECVVQSTNTAFRIFRKDPMGRWVVRNRVVKSSRKAVQYFEINKDSRTIWAGYKSGGYAKIRLDQNFTKVINYDYYPSPDGDALRKVGVFEMRHNIVLCVGNSFYVYDSIKDQVVPFDMLNDKISLDFDISRVVPIDYDNYWIVGNSEAALLSFVDDQPSIVSSLPYSFYSLDVMDDFANIVNSRGGHSLLCTQNSIAELPYRELAEVATSQSWHPELSIASVRAINIEDGIEERHLLSSKQRLYVANSFNTLIFDISYPLYGTYSTLEYRIARLNDGWNRVESGGEISLERLVAGDYALEVRALDALKQEMDFVTFNFTIEPHLALHPLAIVAYVLLFIALFCASIYYTKRRQMAAQRERIEQQEREIVQLENEKLIYEVSYKSKELASIAMSLNIKSDALKHIREELVEQKGRLGSQYPNIYYKKLLTLIDENITEESDWNLFQENFDLIHKNFFRILTERHPSLSAQDLRMCTLLRLNLETKEIAKMMNITIRGVETRRYRLRKKLDIGAQDSLTAYLLDIK